jgi:hypothetical protein
VWYTEGAAGEPVPPATQPAEPTTEPTTKPAPAAAAQGESCKEAPCAAGLTCVKYYGIAGASGPEFASCEIPCVLPNAACPAGQKCITIADGPGRVCRP